MLIPDNGRILLILIGRLGDLIIATPFIKALRGKYPSAFISLIVSRKAYSLARLDPNLSEVKLLHDWHLFPKNLRFLGLAAEKYHTAIDLNPSYSRASLALMALSMARERIAFQKSAPAGFYTHVLPHDPENEHFPERYNRLAEFFDAPYDPKPAVYPSAGDLKSAEAVIKNLNLPKGKFLLGIHAGNFKKLKNRWPEEKFVELTKKLSKMPDIQPIYILGAGEEEKTFSGILRHLPSVPYILPQPIAVTAGILAKLNLLVCNNSGTLQLASAMSVPTFSFDSRYNVKCWRPKGKIHTGVESQKWNDCRDIPVDTALSALKGTIYALSSFPLLPGKAGIGG